LGNYGNLTKNGESTGSGPFSRLEELQTLKTALKEIEELWKKGPKFFPQRKEMATVTYPK